MLLKGGLLQLQRQVFILVIHLLKKWRKKAEKELLPQLIIFDDSIKDTIGLRLQEKLTKEQAKFVAKCNSIHRDISLNF